MNNPLISITIATYNRSQMLDRAIKSILIQNYSNFEIIIVDDGSKDNTEEIVKSFNDPRIIYCKHTYNKGVLAAKNTGFKMARGKYICKLDDDDELVDCAFELLINKFKDLKDKNVKILAFDIINVESKNISGNGLTKEGFIPYNAHLCNIIKGDFWFVSESSTLLNNKFDEKLWGNERQLWLKLNKNFGIYYIPMVLYRAYRNHDGRISYIKNNLDKVDKLILTKKNFLKIYGPEIKNSCQKYYSQCLIDLAHYQILNGNRKNARDNLKNSFNYNYSIRALVSFALTYFLTDKLIRFIYVKYIFIFSK